jgi:hypothetical protein
MEKRSIFFVLILVFISIQGTVIGQRVTISKVSDLIGAEKGIVSKYLNSQEYFFKRSESGFEIFARNNDNGYTELIVGYKNARLNTISWKESVLFSSKLVGEAVLAGFYVDEGKSLSQAIVLVNSSKRQLLTFFDHSREGYVLLNLGRSEKEVASAEKIQARENIKYYCEETESWVYSVQINGTTVVLKLYPGVANKQYKNAAKPLKVITGSLKAGVVKVIGSSNEYLFRLEDGMLYELNNEGGYNPYFECSYK